MINILKMFKMNTEEVDVIKYEVRNINFIFPLISIIFSILILTFTILYYFEKTNFETIRASNSNIKNLTSDKGSFLNNDNLLVKFMDINKLDSINLNSRNLKSTKGVTNDFYNMEQNDQILQSSKMTVLNPINANLVEYQNIAYNFKTYSPKSYGYISMSFKCDELKPCSSVLNNDGKSIFIGNKSQIYHFINKVPPCPLFDTISDQTINSDCTSSCQSQCEVMFNNCDGFLGENIFGVNELNNLKIIDNDTTKLSKVVTVFKKDNITLDMELQSYNPSNSPCFIFTDSLSTNIDTDILKDTYSELIFKIYFNQVFLVKPYIDVYFVSYNSKTSLKNKNTSKEWKEKFGNSGLDPTTFCIYKNLDSILYDDDVFTGDSRINFSIGVQEITNEYFKVVISNNYGFKFSNSFTFRYLIY